MADCHGLCKPVTRSRSDTWHLTPETCLSMFSSTSPDEPPFSHFVPAANPTYLDNPWPMRASDTRHLTPETCLSMFSSTSPDEPPFSHFVPAANPTYLDNPWPMRASDTRHLTPETCLSMFSSTSPDEPPLFALFPPADLHGHRNSCRSRPHTRHLKSASETQTRRFAGPRQRDEDNGREDKKRAEQLRSRYSPVHCTIE